MIPNPFAKGLRELGKHNAQSEACARLLKAHLLGGNAIQTPEPEEVRGHVILAAGRPRIGKSVFCHLCVHALGEDLLLIDLSHAGARNDAEDHGPRSCIGRLAYFLMKDDRLTEKQVEEIRGDEVLWGDRVATLGEILRRHKDPKSLLVRLPPLDPSVTKESAIADDIGRQARLAEYANNSIVLYEYCYEDENKWESVQQCLRDNNRDAQIYPRADFPELSAEDSWAFVAHRLDQQNYEYANVFGVTEADFLEFFRKSTNMSFPLLNRLFDLAILQANNANATRVGIPHLSKARRAMGIEDK